MATNYTELVAEVKSWLDRDDAVLDTVIPTMIEHAESWFRRELHTREMECRISTDLVPAGVADEDRGIYDLPADWAGHKTVERINDKLWITYWQNIPAINAVNPTENWLLTKYPDLYLYGTLSYAEPFLKNDPRASMWSDAARKTLGQLIERDQLEKASGDTPRTITPGHRHWRGQGPDGRLHYLPVYDFYDLRYSTGSENWRSNNAWRKYPGFFTVTEEFIKIWPLP